MQGRLLPRHQVKEDNDTHRAIGEQEIARCLSMGIQVGKRLTLSEMVRSDDVIFAATGITDGDLLQGIRRHGRQISSETLLVRGKSGTVRRIQSLHRLPTDE